MWMNPAITALSSIASAAVIGIARLTSPTRTGILAPPNKALANTIPSYSPLTGH